MPMLTPPNPRFKPMLTSQDMGQGQPQMQQVLREAPEAQKVNGRTPAQIAKERAMAEAMVGQGLDFSPVQHWTQGAARLANELAGMWDESRLAKEEEAGRAAFKTKLDAYDPKAPDADRIAMALVDDPWASEGARGFVNAQIAARKPKEAPGDVQEYEYAKSQGYPGTFFDYQKELGASRASSINLGGGTDKQIFDEMKASADSARSAATGLRSLGAARAALAKGGYFGQFANERLGFAKLASLAGLGNPEKIENTEMFRSAIAPQVAAIMKATVGSTQISNADREFAEKAAAGSILLEEKSIARLLDIMERGGRVAVQQHADRLNQVYPDGKAFGRERALFGVQSPIEEAAPEAPIGNTAPTVTAPPNGTEAPAMPLPKDPTMLQRGKVYATPGGKRPYLGAGQFGDPVP